VGLSDGIRTRVARRRGRWTYGPLESPAPEANDEAAADPVPEPLTEPAKPDGRAGQSGAVVVNDAAETKPDSEVAVATTTTPEFDRAVPRGLQVAAAWSWRVLLVVAVIGGLGGLAGYLSAVFVPVAVAILLAALLFPVASRLRTWGLHRAVATAVTVLGGMALIAGALTLIVTQIVGQASTLSTNVVAGFYQLLDFLRNGPLPVPDSWLSSGEWVDRIQGFLRDSQSTIAAYATEIGAQVGHFLAGFAIALFTLFYFLYDGRYIFTFLLKFFPRTARARVDEAALKGWRSLSSYMRATILVAAVDGIGVLIVALILGVPVAPALAALVFIGAFIPLVGAFVSGFVAVVVALVALGWVQALIMLAGIIVVIQIEGHVLQPFLLGRAVKLHPLAVLLAIAVGIIVGGIVGALMAVPLLAFTKSFIQYLNGASEPPLARLHWPSGHRRA
jgi:predicted PurR-regulated permease PerM